MKAGNVLITDGDGPCYVVSATVKRLDTAIRNLQAEFLKQMYMAKCSSIEIHLTAKTSTKYGRFRVKARKPYQGQRSSTNKPPLLEPLREAIANEANWLDQFQVTLWRDREADDGIIASSYRLGPRGVVRSDDKDMRMTPEAYYDIKHGKIMKPQPEGLVFPEYTEAGKFKCMGQGPLFFWAQALMGDSADNIGGLERYKGEKCGPVLAYNLLKDVHTVNDAANLVLDGYRAINQNFIAEGWLLWLTRHHKDNVYEYCKGLALTGANLDFIEDCVRRDWFGPEPTASAAD